MVIDIWNVLGTIFFLIIIIRGFAIAGGPGEKKR